MFFASDNVYKLFSPSPSGAVCPESVEKAIKLPVGGGIFAKPLEAVDLVLAQELSNGLSRHASKIKMFTSLDLFFR